MIVLHFYRFSQAKWIKNYLLCSTTQRKNIGQSTETDSDDSEGVLSSDSELSQTDIDAVNSSGEWYTTAMVRRAHITLYWQDLGYHFWHDTHPTQNLVFQQNTKVVYFLPITSFWGDLQCKEAVPFQYNYCLHITILNATGW